MWLHNPCRLGVPTALERRAESEVAHKWARWLHNSYRLGGPHRFRAGGGIRGGPQKGIGYITLAACGIPTASEREAESGVAYNCARWPHDLCRLGGPHRFRAGGRIRDGPQEGNVAT